MGKSTNRADNLVRRAGAAFTNAAELLDIAATEYQAESERFAVQSEVAYGNAERFAAESASNIDKAEVARTRARRIREFFG